MSCRSSRHSAVPAALVLVAPTPAFADDVGSGDPLHCVQEAVNGSMRGHGVKVTSECSELQPITSYALSVEPHAPAASAVEHLDTSIVAACVKNDTRNADFQDCRFQQDRPCPDGGEWLRYETVDTTQQDSDPVRSAPFCSGGASDEPQGGDAGVPPLKDIAELVTTAPRIHADNAGRGIRHAHTNFYTDTGGQAWTCLEGTITGDSAPLIAGTPQAPPPHTVTGPAADTSSHRSARRRRDQKSRDGLQPCTAAGAPGVT